MEDARLDWGERLREGKWHIISGILSIALTLWLFYSEKEPQPLARPWPPDTLAQSFTKDLPPEGLHTCRTEGAPAPVELRSCMAGPDKGLETCDARLVYANGKPSHCLVSRCPPLPPHAQHYHVTLGCFLQREDSP